eukprot:scaffold47624_cov17-Prasinocladus_malaysianus.AAC.1
MAHAHATCHVLTQTIKFPTCEDVICCSWAHDGLFLAVGTKRHVHVYQQRPAKTLREALLWGRSPPVAVNENVAMLRLMVVSAGTGRRIRVAVCQAPCQIPNQGLDAVVLMQLDRSF